MAINYTVANTFTPNTVISSSEVNQNFTDNANTWTGIEAMTKTFSHIKMDADPGTSLEVATKQYVDNSVIAVKSGKNKILNGEMRFDQRNEGSAYLSSDHMAKHSLDQWRFEGTGTPEYNISRANNTFPAGFSYSLRVQVSTGGTAAHADGYNLEYPAEPAMQKDWQWGASGAVTVTLSFWVLCNQTGTYSVALLNGVDSWSYVSTYAINAANTWEFKTVTVTGPTTGGIAAWPITGSVYGLKVVWDYGSGSDVTTSTLNAWQANAVWRATGSAAVIGATSNNWQMTGVQLEIGSSASAFEFVTDALMLSQLQRFFWKSWPQGTAVAQTGGALGAITYVAQLAAIKANGVQIRFPAEMFQSPTVTTYSVGEASAKWWNQNQAAASGASAQLNKSASGVYITNTQVSGELVQDAIAIQVTANARLGDI